VAPVAGEDLHPVALEVRRGESFAEPAELVRGEASQVHGGGFDPRWPGSGRQ
jgi:hypothetical protein